MHIITIKGEAKTLYPYLQELDGTYSHENFSEYFDKDFTFKDDIKNGYMNFQYLDGKLYTVTTYHSKRKLTDIELDILENYTVGQWSDGIGEGFEQESCYTADKPFNKYDPLYDDYKNQKDADKDLDVYISPWFANQITTITQN